MLQTRVSSLQHLRAERLSERFSSRISCRSEVPGFIKTEVSIKVYVTIMQAQGASVTYNLGAKGESVACVAQVSQNKFTSRLEMCGRVCALAIVKKKPAEIYAYIHIYKVFHTSIYLFHISTFPEEVKNLLVRIHNTIIIYLLRVKMESTKCFFIFK